MLRLKSHLIGVERGSVLLFSDFEEGGQMWTGNGARETRRQVGFSERFQSMPVVQISMSMWDMDQMTNPRADISTGQIKPDGFEIIFRTWGDTRIARIRADWLAIGELPDPDAWDVT
ncbi:H-type lectin domain-containing protein [Defluviimonas sp. WL0024]|uniref:H-type lectin domain-containing protein n=2 Tax=Albidovulum TaxID=205889 RepID=A0ABT3J4T9_9RHOB|nr:MULTISPECIES: H-type lectin domain-containing protein [Defluviimonas]MCU9849167.1 H-type lectin domain-containing protein [Defluviimonas sp. WL0024]MCW3782706.1 H-type lectin domain-containing protein [Defluviimonas salinarum]